jgi:hypothetical protein
MPISKHKLWDTVIATELWQFTKNENGSLLGLHLDEMEDN